MPVGPMEIAFMGEARIGAGEGRIERGRGSGTTDSADFFKGNHLSTEMSWK